MGDYVVNNVGFDIARLPNLQVWLAADRINQSHGSLVYFWRDLSGNENHAVNFSASAPKLVNKGDSMPTVALNGTSLSLKKSLTFWPITFIFVVQFNAVSNNQYSVFNSFTGGLELWIDSNPPNNYVVLASQSQSVLGNSGAYSFINHLPYIITVSYGLDGHTNYFINGVVKNTGGTDINGSFAGSGIFNIGGQGSRSTAFSGNIAEIMIFNQGLTRNVTEQIEQYLMRKYNNFLPSANPTVTQYDSSSGNEVVPDGTSQLIVEAWGSGGSGGISSISTGATGGAGGGYCKSIISIAAGDYGKNLAWSIGAGGTSVAMSGSFTSGNSGGNTTVTLSGLIANPSNITAGGGGGGVGFPGSPTGGSASGGNTTNTTGGTDGSSPNGGHTGSSTGDSGTAPGGGGVEGDGTHNSGAGADGRVKFTWS